MLRPGGQCTKEEGKRGRLLKSLYGTRDAARNWQGEYSSYLEPFGFIRGISTPSVFYHESREIRVVVRGDDFHLFGLERTAEFGFVQR